MTKLEGFTPEDLVDAFGRAIQSFKKAETERARNLIARRVELLIDEITRRGLRIRSVGIGWTIEPKGA